MWKSKPVATTYKGMRLFTGARIISRRALKSLCGLFASEFFDFLHALFFTARENVAVFSDESIARCARIKFTETRCASFGFKDGEPGEFSGDSPVESIFLAVILADVDEFDFVVICDASVIVAH